MAGLDRRPLERCATLQTLLLDAILSSFSNGTDVRFN